jgi:ABC-type transport system involved in multi-copper enzyme maturation permease subunit
VIVTVSRTVLFAPHTIRLMQQQMPWQQMSIAKYVWLTIYDESLLAGWICLAVVLSSRGLRKEKSLGASAFTLSLPVRRSSVLRAQSFVALVELVALGVLPAFLIPGLSRIVGATFPMTQTLRFAALLILPGVVFHGWSLLLSQLTGSESACLTISLTSIGAFFVLVKRIHALDSLDIFDIMSGADLLDRNTFLLHGPLPWVTFLTALALLLGMVWLSILLIERHDF